MLQTIKKLRASVLITSMTLVLAAPLLNADEILLFQPGQSSWEWLLVPSTHDGGKRMREGKTCLFCHEGEEKVIGNLIASGKKLEPAPVDGMPGFISMDIQASFDSDNLYLKISWASPQLPAPAGDEADPVRLTVMLGGEALTLSAIAGCWAACHNDLPGMPDEQAGQDLTKYLPGSRNKMARAGGGTNYKPEADLAAQLDQGKFLEYLQVVLSEEGLAGVTDGYFLEVRKANQSPVLTATASRTGTDWVVEMVRPLKPEGGTHLTLSEGPVFTIAVALHENHADGRHHFTTFPMRFALGTTEADVNASPRL